MFDFTLNEEFIASARGGETVGRAQGDCAAVDRIATAAGGGWPRAAFDEIDYGMLLLDDHAQVVGTNVAARIELDDDHPLYLSGNRLRARRAGDAAELQSAIEAAARRGLRKLLNMRLAGATTMASVSVVPLNRPADSSSGRCQVLLLLGKRRLGGVLAIEAFARSQGLSGGEARVLRALADGSTPSEVAERHGVAIATVRTQIGCIRGKTGAASIRELLAQIAALPPLLEVLRPRHHAAAAPAN